MMKDDQKTTEKGPNIVELLAMPEVADIDFEPPKLKQGWRKPEETSRLLEKTKE